MATILHGMKFDLNSEFNLDYAMEASRNALDYNGREDTLVSVTNNGHIVPIGLSVGMLQNPDTEALYILVDEQRKVDVDTLLRWLHKNPESDRRDIIDLTGGKLRTEKLDGNDAIFIDISER